MNEEIEVEINAEPTKTFFVDMLTRDIPLEQAILDLVDNSVDGAKSMIVNKERPFEGRRVEIQFNKDHFKIFDNCGGFSKAVAAEYAFRFGRPSSAPRSAHSIGQFGVGMKRALFKFGHQFSVRSATTTETWEIDINVPDWEAAKGWHFPWGAFSADATISNAKPGTEIIATALRPEVGWKFSTTNFKNQIVSLIKSKHRQFIAGGMQISVNGTHVTATDLLLLASQDGKLKPGVESFIFTTSGKAPVSVKIIAGIGNSAPKEAGWYIACNGRVILAADRRPETGWGFIEDESNTLAIPNFHNQFARFRGIVTFDSADSAQVPWNTTKTDVDQDSPVWQNAFGRMLEMMRPVITFLNDLDKDIDEHTRDESPLNQFVAAANTVRHEDVTGEKAKSSFIAPARGALVKKQRTVKIQYSRPVEDVTLLMDEFGVTSAKAVGELCFDAILDQRK